MILCGITLYSTLNETCFRALYIELHFKNENIKVVGDSICTWVLKIVTVVFVFRTHQVRFLARRTGVLFSPSRKFQNSTVKW